MLLFNHQLFSGGFVGGELVYSSPDLYRELSRASQWCVQVRTSNLTLDSKVNWIMQGSADGSSWQTLGGKTTGTLPKEVVSYVMDSTQIEGPGPFTRFELQLEVGTGYIQLWVSGRARTRERSMVSMAGLPVAASSAPMDLAVARPRAARAKRSGQWGAIGSGDLGPRQTHTLRTPRPAGLARLYDAGRVIGSAIASGRLDLSSLSGRELGELARILESSRALRDSGALRPGETGVLPDLAQGGAARDTAGLLFDFGMGGHDPFANMFDIPRADTRRPGYAVPGWRDFGEGSGRGLRDPFGMGRSGLVSDGTVVIPPDSGQTSSVIPGAPQTPLRVVRVGDLSFLVAPDETDEEATDERAPPAPDNPPTPFEELVVEGNEVTPPDGLPAREDDFWRYFRDPRTNRTEWIPSSEVPFPRRPDGIDPGPEGTTAAAQRLAAELMRRFNSPGLKWAPPPARVGGPGGRPPPDSSSTQSRATGAGVGGFGGRRGWVDIEERFNRARLAEDRLAQWIARFVAPSR